MMQKTRI